jgi:hypothetical protein
MFSHSFIQVGELKEIKGHKVLESKLSEKKNGYM